jgi:AraC-like DNA-binding protein
MCRNAMTPTRPQDTPENDRLVRLVAQIATHDGDFTTDIAALSLYRRSKPSDPVHCMYGLGITAAVQSRKRLIVGDETIEYGAGQSLLTTVDLPVVSHIFEASMAEPYLGLLLTLDPKLIAQLAADMHFPLTSKEESRRAVSCHPMDAGLHDAVCRLIALLHEPEALRTQLAPLIQREICVRLLLGAHGAKLRHIVAIGSPAQQIARTVTWIKQNFHQPIDIEALAAQAHMSPSTFRMHFGAVCGISPLQYIKQIRLQEARQMLWTQQLDAGDVAHRVGYESASQFTREYKRLFGEPPLRDARRLQTGTIQLAI